MQNWKAETFRVAPDRRFYTLTDPSGQETITSPLLGTPGHPLEGFVHWWDPSLATVWLTEARNRIERAKQFLASAPNLPDNTKPYGGEALMGLFTHFRATTESLAYFFDALNVPWYLHRSSRELYWNFMSGPPNPFALFDKSKNWNAGTGGRGWYMAGHEEPIITSESQGLIPSMARTLYRSKQNDGVHNKFATAVKVGLGWGGNASGQSSDAEVTRARSIGFTNDFYYQENLRNAIGVDTAYGYGYTPDIFGSIKWGEAWVVQNEHTPLTRANRIPNDGPDPRMFRGDFGVHFGDAAMRMMLGFAHYIEWFDRWISMLQSTPLNEIVISAREMAVYFNHGWIASLGGGAPAEIMSQASRQYGEASSVISPALQVSVAVVSAAGAALATCTYGISALVAGAYALGVSLVGATTPPSRNNITDNKDDLGRFKPLLERAWLSGNPADTTTAGRPRNLIPDPPPSTPVGMVMGPVPMLFATTPAIQGVSPAPLLHPVPMLIATNKKPKEGMSTTAKLAIGGVALAALVKILRP
jgi:hypothetical protein